MLAPTANKLKDGRFPQFIRSFMLLSDFVRLVSGGDDDVVDSKSQTLTRLKEEKKRCTTKNAWYMH